MSPVRSMPHRFHAPDGAQQHREWLSLVEVTGPFLSLPVLRDVWPDLDAVDKPTRERLRREHAGWQTDPGHPEARDPWVEYVLRDLLGWGDLLRAKGIDSLTVDVAEHETTLAPTYVLVESGTGTDDEATEIAPGAAKLLVGVCPPGQTPTGRIPDDDWSATPVDRLARMCRHHAVPLGLVTDGRFWTLVYAPVRATTATCTFDAVGWPETAERTVLRAFVSLLGRSRFFAAKPGESLAELFERSKDQGEELTEALGVQVRQAVELLVAALGWADLREREVGRRGLADVDAHEVYRASVAVMMRIVFLLFAEERHLLPADNDLYAAAYSAGQLRAELEARANEGSEEELEHSTAAWARLRALFRAVHDGVDHPRLRIHPHAGSLFDPAAYEWLPASIDDRTVLHMLRSVQRVEVGTGKSRETRTVSFRALDVEQIGYVYEGLLSFDGLRASELVVGLIGKAGLEEEVPLRDLEAIAATVEDLDGLAAALAEEYKPSGIGSPRRLASLLKPLTDVNQVEARKKLFAVTGGDATLAERLLPFVGILRTDLRNLPVVILPGALYVTESTLRSSTGTHYTPRDLAEEVVLHALQPLVYSPGPLQTADEKQWVPKKADEILDLKVADIAMGSAAFLVAAARYLGDRLVEAWVREGDPRARGFVLSAGDRPQDADADPVVVEARRQIIEHCLYGVDINPMAVEMAKLSLWLISMDAQRSFTFVDDRLRGGDSLLGLTSLDQLEAVHLDPAEGRRLHADLFDWTSRVRPTITEVADLRCRIAEVPDGSDDATLGRKRQLLADADHRTQALNLVGDLIVGAALAGGARDRQAETRSHRAAELTDHLMHDEDWDQAQEQARDWLDTDIPAGASPRQPLHWPLAFPEVFDCGGFDAVIGNPPFLGGQKLTGGLGPAYREYLVDAVGRGARGSADLVAYFVLRAHTVLSARGQTGLIATNTLAQGDTREVGLDQLVTDGTVIRRAVKSKPWPSRSAVLEYCAVWTTRQSVSLEAVKKLENVQVSGIGSSLDRISRVTGQPHRLSVNAGRSFQGSIVLGLGFTMDPEKAQALITTSSTNADVIFPYLNGQDLNSRPDCSTSRWVINFHDWSIERAEEYPECYDQVVRLVKPERDDNPRKPRREQWWRFAERQPAMLAAIAGLERVIVITLVSKTVMPVMVPTGQVFSHALGVFATDDSAMLAVLSSAPHYWWAKSRASSMKADLRYTPSDVFETFALPELTKELRGLGARLDGERREIMLRRPLGLTKLYNEVFDPDADDDDVRKLRTIHRLIDEATVRAYGWDDLLEQGLDHGFHKAGRETRYTVGPAVQTEILDRLLELNHQRYAEEEAAGLHDTKAKRGKGRGRAKAKPADVATLAETKGEEHLF